MYRNIDNRNVSLYTKEFLEWGLSEEIRSDDAKKKRFCLTEKGEKYSKRFRTKSVSFNLKNFKQSFRRV